MKKIYLILHFLALLLLASCTNSPIAEQPISLASDLLHIDSLMQSSPDLALHTLLSFRAERGTSSDINAHYQALLTSEALYKTDNAQLNRFRNETFRETSLQDAMHYFDSLAGQYPTNDDITVLSARSHYMNGVGFYENDSVVEACKEYLHTLEIMESHFDVEKLTGYKAKFMGLTYNRLKELFSGQFMVEQAIYCGRQSLFFCKIAPTSAYGVSNNLAKLGKLYDISGDTDSAYYYYNEALNSLPDTNNLIYRDLKSSLAVLSYELGYGFSPALEQMMNVARQAVNEDELLTRYFVIGGLYFEENIYDSAAVYLNHVFEHEGNTMRKNQSADFLMKIYQITNDSLKTLICSNYLAQNSISIYDKSFDVATLNEVFQSYLSKKSYELQKRNKVRIISIILLFVLLTAISVIFIYTYSARKIDNLNKEHHRVISTERKARYRERNRMLNTIKQQETKVYTLEQELGQKRHDINVSMEAFLNESICKKIKNSVSFINLTSRVNCADYTNLKLDETTISSLDEAVMKYFPNFKQQLLSRNHQLKQNELVLCYLYLLGLKEQQISVLMQYHYSTVFRKTKNLKKTLNIDVDLSEFMQNTAVL